jgi:cell division protein ZapA (FtsZ GTPase activity inhibitor)
MDKQRHQVRVVIAGQEYRLHSNVPDETLHDLARIVEGHMPDATRANSLVLTALSLAHELKKVNDENLRLRELYRTALNDIVGMIDATVTIPESANHDSDS